MENQNICEILEESAVDSAREADQSTVAMASSPTALGAVHAVLERRFHPIHLRDHSAVVNLLLIQLYLLRCELASRDNDKESVSQLQQQIKQLQKEKKICTEKYEEVGKNRPTWLVSS